jgi:solute carrier family 25 folate transporter 32
MDDAVKSAVASQAAGAISTLVVCPLDTVRYRFMAQDGTAARTNHGRYYTRVLRSVQSIVHEEGALTLLRGSHIAVFGATVSWGIYMFAYRMGQSFCNNVGRLQYTFAFDSVISMGASTLNAVLTTPIWLIKTRMQVEDRQTQHGHRHYRTFAGGVKHVVQSEGYRALWTGVRVQVALGASNAIYFPLYELCKRGLQLSGDRKLSSWEVIACSALSKSLIAFGTNPMFVVRTRIQDARSRAVPGVEYVRITDTVRTVYRREGIGGFFRGVVASVALTAPRSALHMLLMEKFMMLL